MHARASLVCTHVREYESTCAHLLTQFVLWCLPFG